MSENNLKEFYGNRVRVRACGCLIIDGKLLMLKHEGLGVEGYFWNVPGGEPEPHENIRECVAREFQEETNLEVSVKNLLGVHEFIDAPLHAIELYFNVDMLRGRAELGYDPEGPLTLTALEWFDKDELMAIPEAAKPNFILNRLAW